MKLIEFIINVFVMVDDFCRIYFPPHKLRARGLPRSWLTVRSLQWNWSASILDLILRAAFMIISDGTVSTFSQIYQIEAILSVNVQICGV